MNPQIGEIVAEMDAMLERDGPRPSYGRVRDWRDRLRQAEKLEALGGCGFDTMRLDWLDGQRNIVVYEDNYEGLAWHVDIKKEDASVRDAIDKAMKGGAHELS